MWYKQYDIRWHSNTFFYTFFQTHFKPNLDIDVKRAVGDIEKHVVIFQYESLYTVTFIYTV